MGFGGISRKGLGVIGFGLAAPNLHSQHMHVQTRSVALHEIVKKLPQTVPSCLGRVWEKTLQPQILPDSYNLHP